MIPRRGVRAAALIGCLLIGGCSHPHSHEPQRASAPDGVMLPANAKPGDDVGGMYVAASARTGVWISPHTTLVLRKERDASKLALVVYVPDGTERQRAWYHAHPLSITGAFADAPGESRCCFSGGVASVQFTVPRALRKARGSVRFHVTVGGGVAARDITSSQADRRTLALILVRLFFY